MFEGMFLPDGEVPLYAEAPLWVIKGFEIFVLMLFVHALWRLRKIANPLYTGAFFAATIPLLYWDWIQNQPSQFRLLYDDRFIYAFRMTDGPGWGPGEPWFIAATYAVHFVPVAWWLSEKDDWLNEKLGKWKWPTVFTLLMPQALIEYFTVGVMKLYKYYMEPEWLTPWGSPWFNFPATALLMCSLAWCLTQSKKLQASMEAQPVAVDGDGQLSAKAMARLPLILGVISTTCAFWFSWVIYHNFWLWSQPWLGGSPWPH